MIFCGLFGAIGGIVYSLDLQSKITFFTILQRTFVSSCAGLLLFFLTYDVSSFTPALRIAGAIVIGFYGTAGFRYLAKIVIRQVPGAQKLEDEVKTLEKDKKENHPNDYQ